MKLKQISPLAQKLKDELLNQEQSLILQNEENSKSSAEVDSVVKTREDSAFRIRQLERNIEFIKGEHQLMLKDLHLEIQVLKRKNRGRDFDNINLSCKDYVQNIVLELQFQLMMGGMNPKNWPGSNSQSLSSSQVMVNQNLTSEVKVVQADELETLEGHIIELQAELHEAKSRNIFLSNLVKEQKE